MTINFTLSLGASLSKDPKVVTLYSASVASRLGKRLCKLCMIRLASPVVNCQRLGSSIEERYTVDLYVPGRHTQPPRDK